MENSIVAKNLSAGYAQKSQNRVLFSRADFSIAKGEFVGVLGPNGAGKTTFFKLLLGLISPLEGELLVFDNKPKKGNIRIGYVPQHHSFDSDLSIEALQIVKLGLIGNEWGFNMPSQDKIASKKALDMLRVVGAEELAHRALNTLSGGELQRIFLAQALVGSPDILLLDEPLANLDIRREGEFVKIIKDVCATRGITVLLIAHNINSLLSVLDKVIYIANGHIAIGKAADVLTGATLSAIYNVPIEVLKDSHGRVAIVGAEESGNHHD